MLAQKSRSAVAADRKAAELSHTKLVISNVIAGCSGAFANTLVAQPVDTIKVKLQLFPHLYPNFRTCALQTLRVDGLQKFYAGFTPALTARLAENAVIFVAYDYSRMIVALTSNTTDRNRLSPLQSALAGGMAGAFAAFTRCPTELIKCRLQTMRELHPKNHSGALRLCRELIQKEGFNGLFTGYTATLLRQSLGNSILFGVYETAREFARREGERRDQIGISRTMLCGGLSGVAYWTSIYPIDVLKSRIQVYGSGTLLTTFLHLIREDGISALFKGLFPTVCRSFISNGALLLTYENTKRLFYYLCES
ncbi:hypothetical protein M3Y96_00403800 [Aphelenchoides besseyi]|nr:hypothetical protein M3Y96_00403800 [Aphelenchoides besseyi]